MLARTFHTFRQNNFFFENALNPGVPCSKPKCGILTLADPGWIGKRVWSKTLLPSCNSQFRFWQWKLQEAENLSSSVTTLWWKKKAKKWYERLWWSPSRRCQGLRPEWQDMQKMVMAWHEFLLCKTWCISVKNSDHNLMACLGLGRAMWGGDFEQSYSSFF